MKRPCCFAGIPSLSRAVHAAAIVVALSLFVAPVLARGGATAAAPSSQFRGGKAVECLRIGQTDPAGDERFHRIVNACAEDLVIFYCVVSGTPYDPEWSVGDCRAPVPDVMAAWNRRMAGLGMRVLKAPVSARIARKSNAGWLDGFRKFGPGIGHAHVDVDAAIADLGDAPLSIYTTRAGEAFVSGTTSYNPLALRSIVVPDACTVDAYLGGTCEPDPLKVWNAIGRPTSPDAAIEAMRAAGFDAE